MRLGSLPIDSEQGLRFVQDRIALFSRTTFLISSIFLVATSAADLLATVARYSLVARTCHVLATLIALGTWRVAASARLLSPEALQKFDLCLTLGACWSFAAMGHLAQQPYGSYTGLLAVTHVSITRAMIVPSLPRRTLLLAVLGFAFPLLSRAVVALPPELSQLPGARVRGSSRRS